MNAAAHFLIAFLPLCLCVLCGKKFYGGLWRKMADFVERMPPL